jgi:ribosomal-protein-alanine N-acetyltransferase
MREHPMLTTGRLVLRPFRMGDCDRLGELCGDRRIADTTALIPHPYTVTDAERWLETHPEQFGLGRGVNFAVTERASGVLAGAVGLRFEPEHGRAELGYWIGVPYWGRGYATEAARAVTRWGLDEAGLHRVFAYHFARNPASGRVLEKIGLVREGVQRGHVRKWGRYEDCVLYGVTKEPDAC